MPEPRITARLSADELGRLNAVSAATGIEKSDLARMALFALLDYVERGNRLDEPLCMVLCSRKRALNGIVEITDEAGADLIATLGDIEAGLRAHFQKYGDIRMPVRIHDPTISQEARIKLEQLSNMLTDIRAMI